MPGGAGAVSAGLTTRRRASLGLQTEAKRGSLHTAPKVPPYCGEEAPDFRQEGVTHPVPHGMDEQAGKVGVDCDFFRIVLR